jgi:hypothetical protein
VGFGSPRPASVATGDSIKMTLGHRAAGAAVVAVLASAGLAHGQAYQEVVLPGATFSSSAYYYYYGLGGYIGETSDVPGLIAAGNGGYASIIGTPNPTISIYSLVSGNPYSASSYSQAVVNYTAELVGPPGQTVPLVMPFSGTSFFTGNALGGAQVYLYLLFQGPALEDIDLDPVGGTVYERNNESFGVQGYSGQLSTNVLSDTPFQVEVAAYAGTEAYVESAQLNVDPIIEINPSFSSIDPNYEKDYTIDVSPGIGNAVVPEPGTWVTLLFGLGVVGGGLRIARRKNELAF